MGILQRKRIALYAYKLFPRRIRFHAINSMGMDDFEETKSPKHCAPNWFHYSGKIFWHPHLLKAYVRQWEIKWVVMSRPNMLISKLLKQLKDAYDEHICSPGQL